MANLNLTPNEVLELYELLSHPLRKKMRMYDEEGCNCCEKRGDAHPEFTKVGPIDCVEEKLKELLLNGIESIELVSVKAKLNDWLTQEEDRIQKLRNEQSNVNNGMRSIHNEFVKAPATAPKKKIVDVVIDEAQPSKSDTYLSVSDEKLTKELNEEEQFKYPKPGAPRPVMPQHGKFRGKHKK